MKYHIDKNGKPAQCCAEIKSCPLGGIDEHFTSLKEAEEYADKINKESVIKEKISKKLKDVDNSSLLRKKSSVRKLIESELKSDSKSAKFISNNNEQIDIQEFFNRYKESEQDLSEYLNKNYKRIQKGKDVKEKKEIVEDNKDYSLFYNNRTKIDEDLENYINNQINNGALIKNNSDLIFYSKNGKADNKISLINKYKDYYPKQKLDDFIKENYKPFKKNQKRLDKWKNEPKEIKENGDFKEVKDDLKLRMEYNSNKIFDKLKMQDLDVIESYVHNDYELYNQYLANPDFQDIDEDSIKNIEKIEKIISKSKMENNIKVYRGTQKSFIANKDIGDNIDDGIFLSTSINKEQAEHFAKLTNDSVLYEINVPKGSKALYIGNNLDDSEEDGYEQELLLSKNTKMKITDKYKNDNGIDVFVLDII